MHDSNKVSKITAYQSDYTATYREICFPMKHICQIKSIFKINNLLVGTKHTFLY